MNRSIFRKYDIRGIAESDLDESTVRRLAGALAVIFVEEGVSSLSVGQDCRLSSPRIADALTDELAACGLRISRLGMVSTPQLYYSQYRLEVEAGIMVTGSHNPGEYNGVKLVVRGDAWSGEQIERIAEVVASGATPDPAPGRVESVSLIADYEQAVIDSIAADSIPFKIVLDCGHGMTGGVAARVYRRLGCRVRELFGRPDGRFPAHPPDPSQERNLHSLQRAVVEDGADLGLAFDGDGDRVTAVDGNGRVVWGDQLTLLFALDLLTRHPGATVVGEVKCTMHLAREIERQGGRLLTTPCGHSIVRREMARSGALLAGEMSGHIFFADRWFGFDDGIYVGGRLLELLQRRETSLARELDRLPVSAATPELRLAVSEEAKFSLVEQAREWFSERYPTSCVDGVRVEFPEGWGLIRASNTSPFLILRFEASNASDLARIRELIETPLSAMIRSDRLSRQEGEQGIV